jgi:hypothetical protein
MLLYNEQLKQVFTLRKLLRLHFTPLEFYPPNKPFAGRKEGQLWLNPT